MVKGVFVQITVRLEYMTEKQDQTSWNRNKTNPWAQLSTSQMDYRTFS